MRTLAIVVASFWVVTAAMADDSCAVQATGMTGSGPSLAAFAGAQEGARMGLIDRRPVQHLRCRNLPRVPSAQSANRVTDDRRKADDS